MKNLNELFEKMGGPLNEIKRLPNGMKPKWSTSKKVLLGIGALAAIFCIGFTAVKLFKKEPKEDQSKAATEKKLSDIEKLLADLIKLNQPAKSVEQKRPNVPTATGNGTEQKEEEPEEPEQ